MPADPDPTTSTRLASSEDRILADERDHLTHARAALRRMRERTERLEAQGGNAWSTESVKAALWHRAQSLIDNPATPLFFGRIDAADPPERFYVGRRHVQDDDGEPLVVDWRAGISRAFYRASRSTPYGLTLRRRFGFQHGELTAYEDEPLSPDTDGTARSGVASQILQAEIERPRLGPMRDIVATIQPEQDLLVRADLDATICVQGAPGTGKTAVGLHRAAYLLYSHRERLQRSGVLVIGPNASFLRYIGDVLPALGEIDARQTTVEDLLGAVPVRAVDGPAAGVLKGDLRLAEVLRRAVWSHVGAPTEPMVLPRGSRRWRVGLIDLDEAVTGLRLRDVRYAAGRAMLPQRISHAVLVQMEAAGESPDDRVQDAVARSRPVRASVDALWPALDPAKLVFRLLTDEAWRGQVCDGILEPDEQRRLAWDPVPRALSRAPWTAADAVLVDEVSDLLYRTGSVGHVVLDEAQDLSPMQLRAVGRRCSTGSATLLGDLAQGTTPWSTSSWAASLDHLGKPGAAVEELTVGFRVPADVIAYAARLLPTIAPGLAPPTSVRTTVGGLSVEATADPISTVVAAVQRALGAPGSVGLVVPDGSRADVGAALERAGLAYTQLGAEDDVDARLDLVPASLAKGLEFDHVVVLEPADIVRGEADERTGLRRLYVCLTRAVSTLTVVHAQPLPAELR
jgi:DNA helicase IV